MSVQRHGSCMCSRAVSTAATGVENAEISWAGMVVRLTAHFVASQLACSVQYTTSTSEFSE